MKYLFFILLLMYTASLHAQDSKGEDINAARPNQSSASQPIPRKTIQIETGVLFEHEQEEGLIENQWEYPTTKLRFGVSTPVEINVSHQFIRMHEKSTMEDKTLPTGSDNLIVGTVVQVTEGSKIFPRIGLSINVTMPTGSKAFKASHFFPEALMAFSHRLSDKFRLRYTLGWRAEEEQADGNGVYVLGTGYKITDKLSAFAEIYGELENMQNLTVKANGGFTYLLAHNIQVDLSAGKGINLNYYFISTGFSIRLPR